MANTHTLLFYDLETTGLNKAFNQIVQFAAIRTDMAFNELERHEIMIKPVQGIIPHPLATITHRTPFDRWEKGEPELTAIQTIHALFNTPGTISLGYNTLSYDDEFLRFCFYRNLLSPYTHQYSNECSRADLYPIAALYSLYHTDTLVWPDNNLKLEQLIACNALTQGKAHTAIADVEACVALAKLFAKQPKTWQYVLGYFNKAMDAQRCQKEAPIALYLHGNVGSKESFQAPVLSLGDHRHYKNQCLWLRLDHTDFCAITLDNFTEHTWVINKKLGEPGFILPYKEKYSRLNEEKKALTEKNILWLSHHSKVLEAIREHYTNARYPDAPGTDVEAALYLKPFPDHTTQKQCQQFHQATLAEKSTMIDRIRVPHLQTLAIRALGRFDASLLSADQLDVFNDYLAHLEEAVDVKGEKRLSKEAAQHEIERIRTEMTLDIEQIHLLEELSNLIVLREV